jgi:hypothetical protein
MICEFRLAIGEPVRKLFFQIYLASSQIPLPITNRQSKLENI